MVVFNCLRFFRNRCVQFITSTFQRYHSQREIVDYIRDGYFLDLLPNKRSIQSCPYKFCSEKYLSDLENSRSFSVYTGFDPTSDSLQLGNLVPLVGLLRCHMSGKDIIILVGGCTGLLGDPSGRLEKRNPQSEAQFATNSSSIEQSLQKLIENYWQQFVPNITKFRDLGSIKLMNNVSWLYGINLVNFMKDYSCYFKIPELLEKESVKLRLKSKNGMDLSEFLYPMLQAVDFLHLHEKYQCFMQIGGHDQLGNIMCGLNLINRKLDRYVFGLTVPLLTTPDGHKLGKSVHRSESGSDNIWLSPTKMKPYIFYQKLLNLPDLLVTTDLIRQLTFFSPIEIEQFFSEHKKHPNRRVIQKLLAQELTLLVHGADALQASQLASRIFFPKSTSINANYFTVSDMNHQSSMYILQNKLSHNELQYLMACLQPTANYLPVLYSKQSLNSNNHDSLVSGTSVTYLDELIDLIMLTKNFKSRPEALRECSMKGVTLNDIVVIKPSSYELGSISEKNMDIDDLIVTAFKQFDPKTGLGILKIGKHENWFVASRFDS